MTRPGAVLAPGASRLTGSLLAAQGRQRVLLVGSERAVRATGMAAQLAGRTVGWFREFTPNPRLEQVLAGSAVRVGCRPDAIVAVGGGSAVDTAKLLRTLPPDRAGALRLLAGAAPEPVGSPIPLVAVPTTAGTGSEVTRFATVYVDGRKASLDQPGVRPEHALVDPDLLRSCPRPLLYACAFDTLCHAVESAWSSRSTDTSRRLALTALETVVDVLRADLGTIGDGQRLALATASTTAGRAIDVTRTTAAHAFSYALTARYGVPHGVACLLNLGWVYEHNAPGPELDGVMARLRPGLSPRRALRRLLTDAGFPDRLSGWGVHPGDVPALVADGLGSARAGNNPVPIERGRAVTALSGLL